MIGIDHLPFESPVVVPRMLLKFSSSAISTRRPEEIRPLAEKDARRFCSALRVNTTFQCFALETEKLIIFTRLAGDGEGSMLADGLGEAAVDALGDGLAETLGDGLAAGLEEGLAAGLEDGLAAGLDDGLAAGLEDGLAAGLDEGLAAGLEEGLGEGAP